MVIRKAVIIALGAVIALGALPAGALYIDSSYVGTSQGGGVWTHEDASWYYPDDTLSAWARFSLNEDGDVLEIVLGNNSPQPTDRLDHVLQGLFFTAEGVLGPAAPVAFANEDRDGDPHVTTWIPDDASWDADTLNTWAYASNLDEVDSVFHDIYGVTHGIANPGIDDPFGPQSTIGHLLYGDSPPWQYWGEHPPYGIAAPGTSDFHTTHNPWIDHSLRFAFHVEDGFTLDNIQDNVVFHYGTSANVVPEPATYSLLGLGLAGLAVRRVIRRKRQ